MAIQKTLNFKEVVVTDAYIRVRRFEGNKQNIVCHVEMCANAEAPAFDTMAFEMSYDLEGANPLKQAYENLKAMPQFSGAVDC